MSKENNLTDFLTDVANAIREKKGTTDPINPQDFGDEIRNMSGGGDNPLVVDTSIAPTAEDLGKFVVDSNTDKMYRVRQGDDETFQNMPNLGTAQLNGIAYGNGRWVIAPYGANHFYYSDDGITWEESNALSSNRYYAGIAYGNGMFVAINTLSTNGIAYSTDGITWTEKSDVFPYTMKSICYGNNKFVAVTNAGSSGVRAYYSTDGINWYASSGLVTSYSYQSVCYGNGYFVTVGKDGRGGYSTDGVSWVAMVKNSTYTMSSVAYANGRFVVGTTQGNIFSISSPLDTAWAGFGSVSPSMEVRGLTYQNKEWRFVGDAGRLYYRPAGAGSWSAKTGLDTSKNYYAMATNGMYCIAVGSEGAIARTFTADSYYYATVRYDT